MIRLLSLDSSLLTEGALFSKYRLRLSSERLALTDACRQDADKRLRLGAGILLDMALAEVGLRERDMCYQTGKNGKPSFSADFPFHFNISHSDPYVTVAVSDGEIGCDVEKIKNTDLAVARRFFCSDEYETLRAEPDPDERNRMFCRLWTLKEALLKKTGDGFGMPMNCFSFALSKSGIVAKRGFHAADCSFFEYSEIDGFCVTCCAESGHPRPALEVMDSFITKERPYAGNL